MRLPCWLRAVFAALIRSPPCSAVDRRNAAPAGNFRAAGGAADAADDLHRTGDEDSCGPNCSEWIAAEGAFDPGSATRLKKFLAQLGDRNLPIFFDSPGGVVAQALAIGRILREREMTAGVARTISADCGVLGRAACDKLKRSGKKLKSDLVTVRAQCNSACVYALAGAKVRQVLPGAHLGIHADKLVRIYNDGRMVAPTRSQLSPREKKPDRRRPQAAQELHRRNGPERRTD